MKTILSLAIASLFIMTTAASAGLFDGQPTDPAKRARPGGYNEQVANKKSLASCSTTQAIKDSLGNVIGYRCP